MNCRKFQSFLLLVVFTLGINCSKCFSSLATAESLVGDVTEKYNGSESYASGDNNGVCADFKSQDNRTEKEKHAIVKVGSKSNERLKKGVPGKDSCIEKRRGYAKSKSNGVSFAKGLSASSASAAVVGAASSSLKSYFNKVENNDEDSKKEMITQITEDDNVISKDTENETIDNPSGKAVELALNIVFVLFFLPLILLICGAALYFVGWVIYNDFKGDTKT